MKTFIKNIKRAAYCLARLFGYKEGTTFGKVVWRVFALSACVVMLFFAAKAGRKIVNYAQNKIEESKYNSSSYCHDYGNDFLSSAILYHEDYDGEGGYIYSYAKGKRIMTDVDWVYKSSDGDSLAVFCSNNKRGYINRYTGEVVIPAQYDKAWIFSEGMACVYKDGILTFIDHNGNKAIDMDFNYSDDQSDYCFEKGLCIMNGDNERFGLINHQGEWVVEPNYNYIWNSCGFWVADYRHVFDSNGKDLLGDGFHDISVSEYNGCIYATNSDHIDMIFDLEGNIINSFDYSDAWKIKYYSDELDDNGDFKEKVANLMVYVNEDSRYGLIDIDGNIITMPDYTNITALAADRYLCLGGEGTVILNDKGEICKE